MIRTSTSIIALTISCGIFLAGCETTPVKKASADPVPLHKSVDTKSDTALPLPAVNADADKITKLEQKIAALENEVAANRPKIAKIDVIEQKFKDLSLGLEKIDSTYNMKPVAQPVPAPEVIPPMPQAAPVRPPAPLEKPVEKKPEEKPVAQAAAPVPKPPAAPVKAEAPKEKPKSETTKPPVAGLGEKVVFGVRTGEQKGFTRMVLDMGKSEKVTYSVDNEEKLLVIDIPGFKWKGQKSGTVSNSPAIASYQASEDDKGAHLIVQLKGTAKVSNYSQIDGGNGKAARAVLDITP